MAEHSFGPRMDRPWLLLIYTVPADPSRKRAAIWREVKRVGAVYLRDGVCTLPDQPDTARLLQAIAARVAQLGGQATLVTGARLEARPWRRAPVRPGSGTAGCCGRPGGARAGRPSRAAWLMAQSRAARAEEYADIAHQAERLLEHVARESEHRDFTAAELAELEADLRKLKRWTAQVRARDYFAAGPEAHLQALLDRCEHALATRALELTPP